MKHPILIQVLLLLLIGNNTTLLAVQYQLNRTMQMAQLSGLVIDSEGLRIADAKLIIEGQGTTLTTVTAEDGTYKVTLLPGVYKIRIERTGFCPMARAALDVKPSANLTINFMAVYCTLEFIMTMEDGKFVGAADSYKLPFREESHLVNSASSPLLNLLVQFGERQESENSIHYKGFKEAGGQPIGVTISYNLLTIHADNVCLNKTTYQFEAVGNAIIEDGTQSIRANRVTISFKAGQPLVQIGQ